MTQEQRAFMRKLGKARTAGTTLETLARTLDVSFASVGRWARGECTPHTNTARRLLPVLTNLTDK